MSGMRFARHGEWNMRDNADLHEKITAILHELKFDYPSRPEQLKILIKDRNGVPVAFLQPVSVEFVGENQFIKILADWREKNWDAYPTVFKVTMEGTGKWVNDQLINRDDRILFLISAPDGKPAGHLGLSNFDFTNCEAEIDNVVRGAHNVLPGIMTTALEVLVEWSFTRLGLKRLFLRVFYDNARAIKLYERCGFKGVKKIPLNKIIDGEVIRYEEIQEGQNLKIDRYFYLMEKHNESSGR